MLLFRARKPSSTSPDIGEEFFVVRGYGVLAV
jgi:hypothetical protein